MQKKKTFPCPTCKGRGGEIEPVLDDGSGPYNPCYCCDDSGFIEVDSEIHWNIRRGRIISFIMDNVGIEDIDEENCRFIEDKINEIIARLKLIANKRDVILPELEKKIKGFDDIPF
jgi:hypothetical protein